MKVSNMNIPVNTQMSLNVPERRAYKTSEGLLCRDPFIMLYDGRYFLYKTAVREGVDCIVSEDLENWSEPVRVFSTPENFHGIDSFFWAPECHYYKGNFYIFTSVLSSKTNHRNISVYRADNPLGPFEDIADGCVGKPDWDTIDGTLYVDGKGQPWMVFVHEWTSMPDKNGAMCAARLSEDLTHFIDEPIELFRARDPKWARNGVTDGPFLCKADNGKLIMIWSNCSEKGYVIGKVSSASGEIDGEWSQEEELLYERGLKPDYTVDGGHGMLFFDKDNVLRLAFHGPNTRPENPDFPHLILKEVGFDGETLYIKDQV